MAQGELRQELLALLHWRGRSAGGRSPSLSESRDHPPPPSRSNLQPPQFSQTLILSSHENVRAPSKLPERLACLDFFFKGDKYLNWGERWESWGEEGQMQIRTFSGTSLFPGEIRCGPQGPLASPPSAHRVARRGHESACSPGGHLAVLQDSRCWPHSAFLQ